jgi:hypothetical protein
VLAGAVVLGATPSATLVAAMIALCLRFRYMPRMTISSMTTMGAVINAAMNSWLRLP